MPWTDDEIRAAWRRANSLENRKRIAAEWERIEIRRELRAERARLLDRVHEIDDEIAKLSEMNEREP